MIKTRMTELLGIRHPVMQGGMQWLGEPELAASVSEAGGLGTVNVSIYSEPEQLRAALRQVKARTANPFCVNISMFPGLTDMDKVHKYIDICGNEGVKAIETSGMSPKALVPAIKDAGMVLIHKVPTVRHAVTAERVGADLVSIVGWEAGGHPCRDEVAGSILVRKAAISLKIPVLMAGGVADGSGLASALALGAEGVVMGTRFVASRECRVSQAHKDWIVSHSENDTVLCQRTIRNPIRVSNNLQARRVLAAEEAGANLEELMKLISGKIGRESYICGRVDDALFPVGCTMGLVGTVSSCQEIMDHIIAEAEQAIAKLAALRL